MHVQARGECYDSGYVPMCRAPSGEESKSQVGNELGLPEGASLSCRLGLFKIG